MKSLVKPFRWLIPGRADVPLVVLATILIVAIWVHESHLFLRFQQQGVSYLTWEGIVSSFLLLVMTLAGLGAAIGSFRKPFYGPAVRLIGIGLTGCCVCAILLWQSGLLKVNSTTDPLREMCIRNGIALFACAVIFLVAIASTRLLYFSIDAFNRRERQFVITRTRVLMVVAVLMFGAFQASQFMQLVGVETTGTFSSGGALLSIVMGAAGLAFWVVIPMWVADQFKSWRAIFVMGIYFGILIGLVHQFIPVMYSLAILFYGVFYTCLLYTSDAADE